MLGLWEIVLCCVQLGYKGMVIYAAEFSSLGYLWVSRGSNNGWLII